MYGAWTIGSMGDAAGTMMKRKFANEEVSNFLTEVHVVAIAGACL